MRKLYTSEEYVQSCGLLYEIMEEIKADSGVDLLHKAKLYRVDLTKDIETPSEAYTQEVIRLSKVALKKYGYEFSSVCNVPDRNGFEVKMPNGESRREALERFKEALDFIRQDCCCDRAGVATHGHVMRIFYYDFFKEDRLFKNCEYFVLDI